MSDAVLQARVSRLEHELARFREKEGKARAKAEKLERKLLRLRGVEPPPEAAIDTRATPHLALAGIAAIRAVFAADPERVWSAAEVNAVIDARGWASRAATHRRAGIEATISRLVRGGELVRVERGRYRAAEPAGHFARPLERP